MKRWLIFFILFAFPVWASEPIMLARTNPYVAGSKAAVAACASYLNLNPSVTDLLYVGYNDGSIGVGFYWTPPVNKTLCQVDMYIKDIIGDISALNFTVKVYTMSGANLDALQGTSDTVSGSTMATNTRSAFAFSTPVSVTASTKYAVLVMPSQANESGKSFSVGLDSPSTDSTVSTISVDNLNAVTEYSTFETNSEIYTQ
jgi:hypothetical protein